MQTKPRPTMDVPRSRPRVPSTKYQPVHAGSLGVGWWEVGNGKCEMGHAKCKWQVGGYEGRKEVMGDFINQ